MKISAPGKCGQLTPKNRGCEPIESVAGARAIPQMNGDRDGNPGYLIGADHKRQALQPVDGGCGILEGTSWANQNTAGFAGFNATTWILTERLIKNGIVSNPENDGLQAGRGCLVAKTEHPGCVFVFTTTKDEGGSGWAKEADEGGWWFHESQG